MEKLKDSTYLFEKQPVPSALWTMAVPTIIGQIIVLIYNMADTFYVGRTGDPSIVAGVSLILPVFNTVLALSNICVVGGSNYISRLLGMGRGDEAKRISSFCIYLAMSIGAVTSVLMLLFMEPVLRFLGAGENTLPHAKQYVLWVIVVGGIPTMLSNTMSGLLRSVGSSKEAGFGVAMGGILNIFLDPLFMFVLLPHGREAMGVGMATCLSSTTACVYYALVVYRRRHSIVISFRPTMPEKESIRQVLNVGLPACITMFLFDVDYMIIDKLIAGYGDVPLAAIGIVLKAERLPTNVGVGLCQGMDPIMGYNYEAKNYKRMRDTMKCAIVAGIAFSVVAIALYEIFAESIMRFFISDAQTVAIGAKFLRARSPATMMMFLSFVVVHAFNAQGKGNMALRMGLVRWLLLNIPMLFILNAIFGMYGIVWSQVTADFINMMISLIIFDRFQKSLPE